MKILKLEIKHLRGIPDLTIEPKGKSIVIYGPNGSGKSAVIDALDFLLTGRIARLIGEGTEGVSLKLHGPHIDQVADLSNVEVNAEIEVPGIGKSVSIFRKMSDPTKLLYDGKYAKQLAPILELLNRGQYVFTRREVLKLITARSSTRAQEIQRVLKLSELEDIRTNLVKVNNESEQGYHRTQSSLRQVKQDVLEITKHSEYSENEVLKFVNEQRKKLGGSRINKLESDLLQESISGIQVNPLSIDRSSLAEFMNNLTTNKVELACDGLAIANDELRNTIKDIKEDAQATWNSKRFRFTEDGVKLLRHTGECPLCDHEYPPGELKDYLEQRIIAESSRQSELAKKSQRIINYASSISGRIKKVQQLLKPVAKSDEAEGSKVFLKGLEHLNDWNDSISRLTSALDNPTENYGEEEFSNSEVRKMFMTVNNDEILLELEGEIKKLFPEATPEQTAWDNLTKLKERIKIVERVKEDEETALMIYRRSSELVKSYVSARDKILGSLYADIKDRFVEFYKEMHGEDEKDFDAAFTPKEAKLNLEVDFYGRGLHPPHAMHSEGHQDSMGVCLFLALSDYLNKGLIDLVILDDVVMSVDKSHRREFCSVLIKYFADKQFVITTHDTTWANQLRTVGLITGKQMLRFSNWDIGSGPMVHYEADMWGRINADLDQDDIPAAAGRLRRGMEEFMRIVCHNLRASVPYTIDDMGSLGDFLPSAIGKYNNLLKKAIESANSWGNNNLVKELKKKQKEAKEIIQKTNVEQWHINKAVHYNAWVDFDKKDFVPVVGAFKELYEKVFSCPLSQCQSILEVIYQSNKPVLVKCKCGAVNWNLEKK